MSWNEFTKHPKHWQIFSFSQAHRQPTNDGPFVNHRPVGEGPLDESATLKPSRPEGTIYGQIWWAVDCSSVRRLVPLVDITWQFWIQALL